MKQIRKMRTIQGIIDYIRKEDKNTAISRYIIENLILARKVYYIKSGNKYLVDLDEVIAMLGLEVTREAQL